MTRKPVRRDSAGDPEIVGRTYRYAVAVSVFNRLQLAKSYQHPGFSHLKQVIRSAGSVGANVEEAQGAQSKADFISKMNLALKEARETQYWMRLLRDSNSWLPIDKAGVAEVLEWLNPKTQGDGHVLEWMIREPTEIKKVVGAIVMNARRSRQEDEGDG